MDRRSFLGRIFGLTAAAVAAPLAVRGGQMPTYEDLPLTVHGDTVPDIYGAPLIETETTAAGESQIPFGAAMRRYLLSGVHNGDFALPPPDTGDWISDMNPLPGWTWQVISGGGIIQAKWTADTSSASGGVIRFTVPAGTPSGEEVCLEQLIPVNSSRGRNWAHMANGYWLAPSAVNVNIESRLSLAYLLADGVTVTGTASSFTSSGGTNPGIAWEGTAVAQPGVPNDGSNAPSDAAFLRLRIGAGTTASVGTPAASRDLAEVYLGPGQADRIILSEGTTPGTYRQGEFVQSNGEPLYLREVQETGGMAVSAASIRLAPGGIITGESPSPQTGTGTAAVALVPTGGTLSHRRFVAPFNGSVIGAWIMLDTNRTGGSISVQVYDVTAAAAIGPTATISTTTDTATATGLPGAASSTFNAGDVLRFQVVTSGYTPTASLAYVGAILAFTL